MAAIREVSGGTAGVCLSIFNSVLSQGATIPTCPNSDFLGRKPKGRNRLPFNSQYPFPRVPQGSFECHSCLVMNHIANARHAYNPKVEGSNPSPATKLIYNQ